MILPKIIKEKMSEMIYVAYLWGYKDKTNGLEPVSREKIKSEVEAKFNLNGKIK